MECQGPDVDGVVFCFWGLGEECIMSQPASPPSRTTIADHGTQSCPSGVSRRVFVKATVAGLTALSASRVLGANERINVGLIGFGLIGRFHLAAIKAQPDALVTAVCDVHKGRVEQAAEMAGGSAAKYGDFRKLLEDKNVDAVYVATPGPLARADDDDGVRGGQRRVCGEAAHAVCARRPLDGRRGAAHQAGRSGRHAESFRPALPTRARTDRRGRAGADRVGFRSTTPAT